MTEMIKIEFGDETEDCIQFIIAGLEPADVDAMGLERHMATETELVGEPLTLAVSLTLTPAVSLAVISLIERWLTKRAELREAEIEKARQVELARVEAQRQADNLRIVANASTGDTVRALSRLAEGYTGVTVSGLDAKPG